MKQNYSHNREQQHIMKVAVFVKVNGQEAGIIEAPWMHPVKKIDLFADVGKFSAFISVFV